MPRRSSRGGGSTGCCSRVPAPARGAPRASSTRRARGAVPADGTVGGPPRAPDGRGLCFGGLNGMLLAVACAGAVLSAIVIDRQDPAAMTTDRYDGRTSAIAYGSRLVFDGIGLWPAIESEAEPIREIRVADDDSPLFLHYDHRELGGSGPLGYIVENRVLRRALFDRAAILPGLKLLAPRAVAEMQASDTGAVITLEDGTRLRTRLVAPADGQNSPLRRPA